MIRCAVLTAVGLQQKLRQHTVEGHAFHEAGDTNEGSKHGAAQHQDGIDRDEDRKPTSTGESSHVREEILPVSRDVADGDEGERQERHEGIEDAHCHPHVAERPGENAFRLLLDEVGGALEPGDPQHRCGETEEERPRKALRGRLKIRGQDVQPPCYEEQAADDEQEREAREVEEKDDDGDPRRLLEADDRENHEDGEQPDRRRNDGKLAPERMGVVHRLARRDHRGRDVGESGEAGGHRGHALARRVQKGVVGAAVQGQGAHHLGVDAPEEKEDSRYQKKRDPRPLAPGDDGERGNVEAGRRDVVPADRGGGELAEAAMLVCRRVRRRSLRVGFRLGLGHGNWFRLGTRRFSGCNEHGNSTLVAGATRSFAEG